LSASYGFYVLVTSASSSGDILASEEYTLIVDGNDIVNQVVPTKEIC
jgi:hypothetical protein